VWLKEVERVMKETLKTSVTRNMLSYDKQPRDQWITDPKLPGQVCLAVSQLYWTRQVTEALNKKGGLAACLQLLNTQLLKLVELVRGDLSPLGRATLGALTVLDVHGRDVVAKMVEEGVKSDKDFEWLSQLRYYYELDKAVKIGGGAGGEELPSGSLKVRMINAQAEYGHEVSRCGGAPATLLDALGALRKQLNSCGYVCCSFSSCLAL
jgi:dynein heavy chain